MGNDNIRSERAKQNRIARKEARKNLNNGRDSETKKIIEKLLIVSEGIKTEPIYFQKLVDFLKLTTTDIEVTGSKHSCPKKLIDYAIELYERSKGTKNEYDLVFCVIDKDTHAHYVNAMNFLRNSKYNQIFQMINSVPCFELWLLLHYEYTTKEFSKTVKNSICTALIKENLKKYLPDYEKNISNLKPKDLLFIFNNKTINTAKERADKLLKHCEIYSIDNPSTRIHDLVGKLQEMKKRPHL